MVICSFSDWLTIYLKVIEHCMLTIPELKKKKKDDRNVYLVNQLVIGGLLRRVTLSTIVLI